MPEINLNEKYIRRFNSRVLLDRPQRCWPWLSTTTSRGYGQMFVAGKMVSAHRIAYQLAHGLIPDGLQVDHICHNRRCCNPKHLRLATNAQNQESQQTRPSMSGVRGVYAAPSGRWRTHVRRAGKHHTAGTFDTLDEAERAVVALRRELGFRGDEESRHA